MLLFLAFLIGIIAGLRAMTAPAAVAWGAALGWFDVSQTPLAFMGYQWTPWIFTVLAAVELDHRPVADDAVAQGADAVRRTHHHGRAERGNDRRLGRFSGRRSDRGHCRGRCGTLGGAAARGKLASVFGKDLPAALIEDVVAIGGALLIVGAVS